MVNTILKIKNWERYQHYKDRRPPWIKIHFSLLSSKDWVMLSDSERVLALASMLIASQSDLEPGCFEADPDYFQRVAYLSKTPDFNSLIKCGFLEYASGCKQTLADVTTETETETEEESQKTDSMSADADGERRQVTRSRPIDPSVAAKPAKQNTNVAEFERFWSAYPRHENKKKAREAWVRKRLDKLADRIVTDLEKRKRWHDPWRRGITPHATTYLNGERWEDAITPPAGDDPANTADAVAEAELKKLEARRAS